MLRAEDIEILMYVNNPYVDFDMDTVFDLANAASNPGAKVRWLENTAPGIQAIGIEVKYGVVLVYRTPGQDQSVTPDDAIPVEALKNDIDRQEAEFDDEEDE